MSVADNGKPARDNYPRELSEQIFSVSAGMVGMCIADNRLSIDALIAYEVN